MSRSRVPARDLWLLLGGFTLWAAAFAAIYGLNGLGCAAGWHLVGHEPLTLQRAMLAAAAVVSVAAIGWLGRHVYRRIRTGDHDGTGTARFLGTAGLYATIAALGAAIFTFAPVILISTCI